MIQNACATIPTDKGFYGGYGPIETTRRFVNISNPSAKLVTQV